MRAYEYRDVVPDDIPVSGKCVNDDQRSTGEKGLPLLSVELHGEATDVTDSIRASATTLHSRETHKNRGVAGSVVEDAGT